MTKVQIHTLDWHDDTADQDGDEEPATASIYCVVMIDGREIEGAIRATPSFGNDFATVNVEIAGNIEVVHHTAQSWAALLPMYVPGDAEARNGRDELVSASDPVV